MRTLFPSLKTVCLGSFALLAFSHTSIGAVTPAEWTKQLNETQTSINRHAKQMKKKFQWPVELTFDRASLGDSAKFCAVEHYYCAGGKTAVDGFIRHFVDRVIVMNIASHKNPKKHPDVWKPIYKIEKIQFSNGTEKKVELQGSTLLITQDWTSAPYRHTNGAIPNEEFYFEGVKKAIQ